MFGGAEQRSRGSSGRQPACSSVRVYLRVFIPRRLQLRKELKPFFLLPFLIEGSTLRCWDTSSYGHCVARV